MNFQLASQACKHSPIIIIIIIIIIIGINLGNQRDNVPLINLYQFAWKMLLGLPLLRHRFGL
jgi:hypothetical protein